MKNNKLPAFERLLIFSFCLTFGILLYRCIFSGSLHYTFLLWNLFLAITPYLVSKQLVKCKSLNLKSVLLLTSWLLLFPNSPYILSDIFHFSPKDNIPFWYDSLLFLSAAWTGLLPGLVSLRKVETFLSNHLHHFWIKASIFFCLLLSGYGVYLGRFLRFNSWDVFTDSKRLIAASERDFVNPEHHLRVWIFVVLFAIFMDMLYVGFKNLPTALRRTKRH
jgi:uncharacterized membrane protein